MSFDMGRHRSAAYLSILVLLSIGFWLPRLQGPLDLRYDAGVYYILGTSLVEGKGYRLLNEPGEIEAIQYPPLLPLFAAAHQLFAGSTDPAIAGHWLRVSFFLLFVASIIAAFALCRRFLAPGFSFVAVLISLLHVNTLWLSELFFAELPFMLTSILFLIMAGRDGERSSQWLAGLLGAASFLLRTTGIALFVAWGGTSLLRRRFKEMGVRTSLALLLVVGWQGYILQVKSGEEYQVPAYDYQRAGYQFYNVGYLENLAYIDPFVPELGNVAPDGLVKRIGLNLLSMPASWGEALSARMDWSRSQVERINQQVSPVAVPLWTVDVSLALLAGLVLAGLGLLARRGEWLIPLYVAGSVTLICLTPWPGQFERYLAPLSPLFALALCVTLAAVRACLSRVAHGRWRFLGVTLIVIVGMGIVGQEAFALWKVYTKRHAQGLTVFHDERGRRHEYRLFFYTRAWRLHDEALEWLEDRARPGAVIATSTPQWAYLKTGFRAVMPPFEPDIAEAQRLLDSVPVTYVIIDQLQFVDITRRYAAPVVRAFPKRWELIYATAGPGSRIYRRVPLIAGRESP